MQKIFKISVSCVALFFGNYSYTSINQNSSLYLSLMDPIQLTNVNDDNFNKNQPIGSSVKSKEGEDSVSEIDTDTAEGLGEGDFVFLVNAAEDYFDKEEIHEVARREYPEHSFPQLSTNSPGWYYGHGDLFPIKRKKISKPNTVAERETRAGTRFSLENISENCIFKSIEFRSANQEEIPEDELEEVENSASGSDTPTGCSSPTKRRKVSQSDKKHDMATSSSDLNAFRNTNFKNYITQTIVTIKKTNEGHQYKETRQVKKYSSYFLFHDSFNKANESVKYDNLNKYIGSLRGHLEELEINIDYGLNDDTQREKLNWYSILENQYETIDVIFFNTFSPKEELILDANVRIFLALFVGFCQNVIDSLDRIISYLPNRSKISVYHYWIRDFDELKRRLVLYDNINNDIDSVCENMYGCDMPDMRNSPIKMEVINAFNKIYTNTMWDFKNFLAAKGYYKIFVPDNLIQEFASYPQYASFLCLYDSGRNIYKFLYCCANYNRSIIKDFLSQYRQDFCDILNKVENEPINIKFLFENFNVSYKALREYLRLSISSGNATYEINDIIITG